MLQGIYPTLGGKSKHLSQGAVEGTRELGEIYGAQGKTFPGLEEGEGQLNRERSPQRTGSAPSPQAALLRKLSCPGQLWLTNRYARMGLSLKCCPSQVLPNPKQWGGAK